MFIGAHLSISKGFKATVMLAHEIGANTFQFFTRNPRGSKAKALDDKDLADSMSLRREYGFGPLVAHTPYTINLGASNPDTWEFAVSTLKDDLIRAEKVGALLVVHPGSHGGQGIEYGLSRVVDGLNRALADSGENLLLLEAMSGQGNEVGSTFEELNQLMQGVKKRGRVGIALDTCHLYGAGYDLKNDLDGVLASFDRKIGLKYLHALHINDSETMLGSHRDRHANLGNGSLGMEFFAKVVKNPVFKQIPLILETPDDSEQSHHKREIEFLKKNSR
ncbi:MAG: deoxyribonuclease IV [Firmicutes bacterium]|nr:deoxyribonuclease IV [Bacillota bacterium]